MLGASIAVADESRQRRASVRIAAKIPLQLLLPDGKVIPVEMVDISSGGAKLHPLEPCNLQTGQVGSLAFDSHPDVDPFPVNVVQNSRGALRLKFKEMSLAREAQLVGVIYGRADSWISWRTGRPDDHPLLSFIQIAGYSVAGLGAMLKALIRRRRPADDGEAMARQPMLPLILILGLFLLSPSASAQTGQTAASADTSTFSDAYDLSSLGERQTPMLRGVDARSEISFRIPLTKVVTAAHLDLRYHVSPNVIPEVSQIQVTLNGTSVGSIPILPNKASPHAVISAPLELPAELLTSENTLRFQVAAKCRGCDDAAQAELWTRIELTTQLHLSGSILALANDLRLLPAPFFDSSLQRIVQVPFVFADPPDALHLEAAGVIASWFGILADYRATALPVSVGRVPPGNVVVIGTNKSGLLTSLGLGATRGPSITMRDNPNDRYGKLLLVAGENASEVLTAARGLALGKARSGDSVGFEGVEFPPRRKPYDAPRWLNTDHQSRLSDVANPEQLPLMGSGTVHVFFRLPPDLYFDQKLTVPFGLVYRSKGLPPRDSRKSQISVSLNGKFVTSKPIDARSLQANFLQTIYLPVAGLAPNNTLNIDFNFGPKDADTRAGYTEATVLDESELDLEGIPHFAQMPRLELYANSGFPFTRLADLAETAVVLPETPDTDQIETYLELLAFFGARTGYPGLQITVLNPSQVTSARNKDLLVLTGTRDWNLPESWRALPGLRWRQGKPTVRDRRSVASLLPWTTTARERARLTKYLSAGSTPDFVLQEFPSPVDPQRVVALIQTSLKPAESPLQMIFRGDRALAHIYGDVSVFEYGEFHSFEVAPDGYHLGRLTWHDTFNFWVGRHFLVIPLVLVAFALLLALALDGWLSRRAKWRLQLES